VRLWAQRFCARRVEALKTSPAPGPAPVKAEAALRVVTPLLEALVADRHNWTLARPIGEIEAREGVTISKSRLSRCCATKVPLASTARLKLRQAAKLQWVRPRARAPMGRMLLLPGKWRDSSVPGQR
jgi:hypothetical protein